MKTFTLADIEEKIKNLEVTVAFQGLVQSPWESFKFTYTVKGESFDYFLGIGHIKGFKLQSTSKKLKQIGHDLLISTASFSKQELHKMFGSDWDGILGARIKTPSFAEVLICVSREYFDATETFEGWCSNFGLDTDSRKALSMYLKCQTDGVRMRKAVGQELMGMASNVEDY